MEELICPLTLEPINEPVMTFVGQIYEKKTLDDWLKISKTDPIIKIYLPPPYYLPLKPDTDIKTFRTEMCNAKIQWFSNMPFRYLFEQMQRTDRPKGTINSREYSLTKLE